MPGVRFIVGSLSLLALALCPPPCLAQWRVAAGGGAVSAEATATIPIRTEEIAIPIRMADAQAQIFVSKIDDHRCQPRLRSRSLFRNLTNLVGS